MKYKINALEIFVTFTTAIVILVLIELIFNSPFYYCSWEINPKLASEFGTFIGGVMGTLLVIPTLLFLVLNFFKQNLNEEKRQLENSFFKMIDYHNENVKNLQVSDFRQEKGNAYGRNAFVSFKIQMHQLFPLVKKIKEENKLDLSEKDIIDIAYIILYYGFSKEWIKFIEKKLERYKEFKTIVKQMNKNISNSKNKLGNTNQTSLSPYFRNMYNAIELIDKNKRLSKSEKQKYIKIYKAQLSNPELYILFFHLTSRFGKKWIDNNFIKKYHFIENLPKDYLEGIDPNKYFELSYYEEES